jgi:hypothetical protein
MIGMQSSLDRILTAIESNNAQNANFSPQSHFPPAMPGMPGAHSAPFLGSDQSSRGLDYYPTSGSDEAARQNGKSFPPLPGFAAPVSFHLFS